MLLFTRLTPHGAYASHVLPGLVLTGPAMGCVFAPAFSTATLGVKSSDAGIASAMVNTSQQVGGSIGTALLSTIFASAAASFASVHAHAAGITGAAASTATRTAFYWAAGCSRSACCVALVILPTDGAARARTAQAPSPRPISRSAPGDALTVTPERRPERR